MSEKASFTPDERLALALLAHLFVRMGFDDKAGRCYAVLREMAQSAGSAQERRLAHAGLAVSALVAGKTDLALDEVKAAIKVGPLASRDAALHLLKAQILWRQGREAEAQHAFDTYTAMIGGADAATQS